VTAPLVSLCIPAYNAAPFIGATLDSLARQTWQHWEAIVVDDGSTDDTLEVARRHAGPRIHVVTQPNAGQSAAENRAIERAQGDFFVFLDADDFMSDDKLEAQVRALGDPSAPLMATCAWGRFHTDPARAEFRPTALWRDLAPTDWLVTAWENNLMMHGATWLIPRPVLERSGGWNPAISLINDHEFFPRVMLQTERIVFTPGVRTYYRSGFEGNLSGQRSRRAWESAFLALKLSSQMLLQRHDTPEARHACAVKLQRFIYEIHPACPDLAAEAAALVAAYGGCHVEPEGGRWFHRLRRVMGWRAARRIEQLAFRMGYKQSGMKRRWEGR